jgi:hypothetical protein
MYFKLEYGLDLECVIRSEPLKKYPLPKLRNFYKLGSSAIYPVSILVIFFHISDENFKCMYLEINSCPFRATNSDTSTLFLASKFFAVDTGR